MANLFPNLSQEILNIFQAIADIGGEAFLVGGCVRDQFFGHNSKDIDIEVFGVSQAKLEGLLKPFGKVDTVGQSFGVTKLTTATQDYDFNLPRRERKQGVGHKGFDIEVDQNMSVYEAGLRRDLTMNAIYYNPLTKEVIDNFGGVLDIEQVVLRHVSPKFAEDPLRVERLMQFAGRMSMLVAKETVALCKTLIPEFGTISKERHWIEFEKLMRKGKEIGYGLVALSKTGWIVNFPQLDNLGWDWMNIFNLGMTVDNMKDWAKRNNIKGDELLTQMFATLCYKMSNPLGFMVQIDAPKKIQKKVVELCNIGHFLMEDDKEWGEKTLGDFKKTLSDAKHNSLRELKVFLEGISRELYEKRWNYTMRRLDSITEENITPRIVGQDLLDRGWKPSKEFGQELKRLFDIQLREDASREELLDMINEP